ncbi:MAG: glycosyltransferase [Alphaproteobacteria bacterium]|nr:glycosyltransferase [Alphaproteobacteria bacterium]
MPETDTAPAETPNRPLLSVVVPVLNEEQNVAPLAAEIRAALDGACAYEIIYVNDGSTDGTATALAEARAANPMLRVVEHAARSGQSAALRTGITAARGLLIATLDGDRQNDPADIPTLLDAWHAADRLGKAPVMITGHRVNRCDSWAKHRASRVANWLRRATLGDDNPDTGCSLKLFERALFLRMPYFDHMHRFLPALALREGAMVEVVPVNHRPRPTGTSKYRILDRLLVGIPDLLGVMWLMRRRPNGQDAREIE